MADLQLISSLIEQQRQQGRALLASLEQSKPALRLDGEIDLDSDDGDDQQQQHEQLDMQTRATEVKESDLEEEDESSGSSDDDDDSSSSGSSDANDGDDDEDEQSKEAQHDQTLFQALSLGKHKKARRNRDDDGQDYDDDEESGAPAAKGPLRTEHELESLPPVEPVTVVITEDMPLEPAGHVTSIIPTDKLIVITAAQSGAHHALDEGTVLCLQDRTIVGALFETFGPVTGPLYSVRFVSAEDVAAVTVGAQVFHVPNLSHWVHTQKLKKIKGSDASNRFDEEVDENELEFSDDEEEARHRQYLKSKRREGRQQAHAKVRESADNDTRKKPRHEEQESSVSAPTPATDDAKNAHTDPFDYQPLERPARLPPRPRQPAHRHNEPPPPRERNYGRRSYGTRNATLDDFGVPAQLISATEADEPAATMDTALVPAPAPAPLPQQQQQQQQYAVPAPYGMYTPALPPTAPGQPQPMYVVPYPYMMPQQQQPLPPQMMYAMPPMMPMFAAPSPHGQLQPHPMPMLGMYAGIGGMGMMPMATPYGATLPPPPPAPVTPTTTTPTAATQVLPYDLKMMGPGMVRYTPNGNSNE
ncbi:hypothetical protein RI367_003832 [Sorochytrium milnesiophthora]